MELLNSFLGKGVIAQIGKIVLFANTITMVLPTRWKENMVLDYIIFGVAIVNLYNIIVHICIDISHESGIKCVSWRVSPA